MIKKKLPKSLRKYIRMEKARIRRGVLNLKEQQKLVDELYQKIKKNFKITKKDENKRNF
jgi:hypothetical protein